MFTLKLGIQLVASPLEDSFRFLRYRVNSLNATAKLCWERR